MSVQDMDDLDDFYPWQPGFQLGVCAAGQGVDDLNGACIRPTVVSHDAFHCRLARQEECLDSLGNGMGDFPYQLVSDRPGAARHLSHEAYRRRAQPDGGECFLKACNAADFDAWRHEVSTRPQEHG